MNKLDFYINQFIYANDIENLDFSFIPSMLRRKLSPLNKTSFYVLEKCCTGAVENIVYSSRYGEFDKLKRIIDSFTVENCVSPTVFSSSVHNATVGAYLYSNKLNKPYVALAATQNTLSSGLLYSVINNYETNLFCYSDYIDEKPFSLAMIISPNPTGQHFVIDMESCEGNFDEKNLLISLLEKQTDAVQFNNYRIEAM